jgi:hypothetical protein
LWAFQLAIFLRVVVASFRWTSATKPWRKEKAVGVLDFSESLAIDMMRLWGKGCVSGRSKNHTERAHVWIQDDSQMPSKSVG